MPSVPYITINRNWQIEMGKDKEFKKYITSFIENNKEISTVEQSKPYKPDAIFRCNNTLFILECSSTGDRKAILGELFGAFLFFKKEKEKEKDLKCKFITFLTGVGVTAPTTDGIEKYLNPYLEYVKGVISDFEIIYKSKILDDKAINVSVLHENLVEILGIKIAAIDNTI